jgi:hypothetical protein
VGLRRQYGEIKMEKSWEVLESSFSDTREEILTEIASRALMKRWFPKGENIPRDEKDASAWREISFLDAECVIKAIKECGVNFIYPVPGSERDNEN